MCVCVFNKFARSEVFIRNEGEYDFLTFLSKGSVLVLLRQLRYGLGTLRLLPWVITGDQDCIHRDTPTAETGG